MKTTRRIGTSRVSLTGLFHSSKNNRQIQFESSLELDFAEILEFDQKVETYLEQPARIELAEGWYYPDFLVKYTQYSKTQHDIEDSFFEIKYSDEIERKKDYYESRFAEISEKCRGLGFEFHVLSEEDIRNDYLENVKMLNYYKHKEVDKIILDMVLDYLSIKRISSPREIQSSIKGGLYEKSHTLFVIWHLLANQRLFADLYSKLNMDTELMICDDRVEY